MAGVVVDYFYHALLRKAIQIFGSRFNDIQIKRIDDDSSIAKTIEVPISYGPMQKYLARIQGDPSGARNINTIFPRMTFEITNIQRDTTRKIQKTNRLNLSTGEIFVPVPYDIQFQLSVVSINAEDGLKVVEQILPYFNPELALKAKLLDNHDALFDVPLILDSTTLTDTYEGDFTTRRAIIWSLDFTLKYHMFGPIREADVIKFVKINTYSDSAMTNLDAVYTTQPGLTANGEPTTDINDTVDYTEIDADDDYGFIFQSSYGADQE